MSEEKEVDVCIMGWGAGGAPVAYALGKAGFSVVVLEAGPLYDPNEYHLAKKDWERYPYPQPFVDPKLGNKKHLYTYSNPEELNPKYKKLRSWSKSLGQFNKSDRRQPPHIDRAKGSMDVTLIPKAEATGNVEVRPNSVVREITIDEKGKVDGVIYFDSNKKEKKQMARIVVVSARALESPRLLLNSKSSLFRDGLANSSGLVGKNFIETI